MSLDERLTSAARQIADGLVTPAVDLASVRAQARSNRRRTTSLAVLASVAAVIAVAATATTGRGESAPEPVPPVSPSPTASPTPTRPWTPDQMTPEAVVRSSGAALQMVGIAPGNTDIRLSIWKQAGYLGMALTSDGYRTVSYAAVPPGVTEVVGSPKDGVFLLSDGVDHEWLVDVAGAIRPVKRVSTTFVPADPRLWFPCVYGSWRSRWCSLDLATATAHVSSDRWAGSAVHPGLGVEPWGAHPEPRTASSTGRLEAWWYSGGARRLHTVATAHDGDYILGTARGEMAFWAPGVSEGTIDLYTSSDGGATWEAETRAVPGIGRFEKRVIRSPGGGLLLCAIGDELGVWRADAAGGPFRKAYEILSFGRDTCAGFGVQGDLVYLNTGDSAATSSDDGRTWTSIETWR